MKRFFKWFGITCGLFLVLIIVVGIMASDKPLVKEISETSSQSSVKTVSEPSKPVFKTSAIALTDAYNENEVATDEKLKGKLIEVYGMVQSIDKDFTDSIVINLSTENEFMPAGMTMEDDQKNAAIHLKKGQKVTIVCEKMMRVMDMPAGSECTFK